MAMRLMLLTVVALSLGGCVHTSLVSGVPACDKLIPGLLLDDTPAAEAPVSAKLPDGHDDARPWQIFGIQQTGQLAVANEKPRAVDHIYKACLANAAKADNKSKGFLGGLFGG